VDRQRALQSLTRTHASALALRDRGFDDSAIAAALSLELEAVPSLLRVAEEKLAALADVDEPDPGRGSRTSRSEVER